MLKIERHIELAIEGDGLRLVAGIDPALLVGLGGGETNEITAVPKLVLQYDVRGSAIIAKFL